MTNEWELHAFPVTCFASRLYKSVCLSTAGVSILRFTLMELVGLASSWLGVMAEGQLESWGRSTLCARCPISRALELVAVLAVQGSRLCLRTTVSERSPFVSLLLVPALFFSPVTKINRPREMMDNCHMNCLGRDDPLCRHFPYVWEQIMALCYI